MVLPIQARAAARVPIDGGTLTESRPGDVDDPLRGEIDARDPVHGQPSLFSMWAWRNSGHQAAAAGAAGLVVPGIFQLEEAERLSPIAERCMAWIWCFLLHRQHHRIGWGELQKAVAVSSLPFW